ncbi:hypothetical protein TrST_g10008 [Triparma strigata]|uniref:Vacuolar protein sorting-associated protein 51 homolog n=1 Tax=Triparma strigata TaxID=1606541 RepID=A0A9W7BI08_9STRA|nr:hypothetical protein TrST_g10008 [Triparma strigata]
MSSSDDSSSDSESDDEMRRNIMASYYGKGLNEQATPPQPTHTASSDLGVSLPSPPSSSSSSDPLSSSTFDPLSYSRNLLTTSSTDELLTHSTSLYTTSLSLDSTMQTLVYENYSKFISATDEIRCIGESTGLALSGMRRLVDGSKEIEERNRMVEEELKEGREEVDRLWRVKVKVEKLSVIRTLEERLKGFIEKRKFKDASLMWERERGVLVEHRERFKILDNIYLQCSSLINTMILRLKKTVSIGSPASYRWWFNISRAVMVMGEGSEEFRTRVEELAERDFRREYEGEGVERMLEGLGGFKRLGRRCFGDCDVSRAFGQIIESWKSSMMVKCDENSEGIEEECEQVRGCVAKFGVEEWDRKIKGVTVRIIKRLTAVAFRKLRVETIEMIENWMSTPSSELIKILKKSHNETLKSLRRGNVESEEFRKGVTEEARLYVIWVAGVLEGVGGGGSGKVVVGSPVSEEYMDDLNTSMMSRHEAAVTEDPFNVPLTTLMEKAEGKRKEENYLPLKVAVICREAEGVLIESASKGVGKVTGGGSEDIDTDGAVSLRFSMAASECLSRYTCDRGHAAARALGMGVGSRTGRRTWTLGEKVVRGVRGGVGVMLKIIKEVCMETGGRFGGLRRSAPAKVVVEGVGFSGATYGGGGGVGQQRSGGLAMDIEKLFAEKIVVYGSVEFSRESVVLGVFKIAMQSLLLAARQARFSVNGLTQVQVDIALLRHLLPHYLSEHAVVDKIMDNVLAGCAYRCESEEQADTEAVIQSIMKDWLKTESEQEDEGMRCLIWDSEGVE